MAAYQLIAESKKATAPKDETGKTSADTDIEKLKGSMQEFRKAVDDAEKLGLPIGWEDDQFFNSKNIEKMGLFVWFLTTVFTGFLIGLGGPFWFDMVKRLTGVSQVTGALIRQPPPQAKTGDWLSPVAAFLGLSPVANLRPRPKPATGLSPRKALRLCLRKIRKLHLN